MATDSKTSWVSASGSLLNCLTFQTFLSVSDDESSTRKPLLLHSPSPDSSPCDITINLAVKHEVRQVYVRSTARVYEIYCAPDLKSNNEYLCTVRCGLATRDGEVLRSPNFHEIVASLPSEDSCEENVKSEDDWVVVELGDTSGMEGSKISSEAIPYIDSITTDQDLFEATAEIDNMNPCISITLRLLSLQSKGCVCVDEIYVFGDPVESENQESHNENSSGSSLMAMFLPTLMQMSKTTGLSHLNAVRKENRFVSEDDLKETPHPSDSVIENQLKGKASITDPHEEKLKEMKGEQSEISNCSTKMEFSPASVPLQATQEDSNCSAIPSKLPEMENNHIAVHSQDAFHEGYFSGCNVERFLEKLMSRMDRIEEICLGFQEKMVMPMNNIEIRLQHVEQQFDTLSKKSQNSALPSGYRITAPDVSCIESDPNSCENCVDYTDTREVESDMKYLHAEEQNVTPYDISDSENTTQLLPGLVVTAPEFPEGEGEDDNALEQKMTSSNDKGNQSINDANFLSSLSSESPKSPGFSDEDDDDHESNTGTPKTDPVQFSDSEQFTHIEVLASSHISLENGEKLSKDSTDKKSEKTAQEAEQHDEICSTQADQEEACVNASILPKQNLITDVKDNVEEDKIGKMSGQNQNSDVSASSNINNISNELIDIQITEDGPSARTEHTVANIENVLGFSLASPVIDFEIPVLDVRFISQTIPVQMSYLDALLVNNPDTSRIYPSVKESNDEFLIKEQNDDLSVEVHSDLISVDDVESVYSARSNSFILDEVLSAPVSFEGDNLAENHISTSGLI